MTTSDQFSLTLTLDNDAFQDNCPAEVARILREAAAQIEEGDLTRGACRDANGNTVGVWRFLY